MAACLGSAGGWMARGAEALPATTQAAAVPPSAVPAERLARLARGVNLQGWLWPGNAKFDDTHAFHPVSDADLQLLHDLGMTHVRLPIAPEALVDLDHPTVLAPKTLAAIDSAIQRITAHQLAVVVDFHASNKLETLVANDDKAAAEYVTFWKTLAAHLANTDPDWVFLELMNEPKAKDLRIQPDEVAAIRTVAPHHTIIATGPGWSGVPSMHLIQLIADDNIVYTFHFYEPMTFTHQGATWAGDVFKPLKDIPYPATPEAVEPLIAQLSLSQSKAFVRTYGQQRWDADVVYQHIKPAADWAAANHVPIWCGEFGVFIAHSPHASRVRWIHDVRSAIEHFHVGWCMWDFDGGFCLKVRNKDKTTTLDADVANALGLNVPATQPANHP